MPLSTTNASQPSFGPNRFGASATDSLAMAATAVPVSSATQNSRSRVFMTRNPLAGDDRNPFPRQLQHDLRSKAFAQEAVTTSLSGISRYTM